MRMEKLNSVCAEVNVNILALISPSAGRLERTTDTNHVHPEGCLHWHDDIHSTQEMQERLLALYSWRAHPVQPLQNWSVIITGFPLPFRAIQQNNALDCTGIKVHPHLAAQRLVEFTARRIGLTIEIHRLSIPVDPNSIQRVRNKPTGDFPTGNLLVTDPTIYRHHQAGVTRRPQRFGPIVLYGPLQ